MLKYLDLHGKDIYTSDNRCIGFIDNGIVDFKSKSIRSIIISNGRLFPSLYIAPFKNVVFMKDRIILSERPFKMRRRKLSRALCYSLEGVIGRDILDGDGVLLGEVEDVVFDPSKGSIKAVICKRGFYDDLIRGKKVMLVNEGFIIRKDSLIAPKSSIEMICEISFSKDFEQVIR
ncbi:MAG: PRC-barrel domain-containing protein [Clostridium sp.]|uniref:PRC-barrel domain-containing protein n=1 Tax=Clostridium sp. TaxID=1506 RepID=UPI002FCCAB43